MINGEASVNVLPRCASLDFADDGLRHAVVGRNDELLSVVFTDSAHIIFGQLGKWVRLAVSCAALVVAIFAIVNLRTEKKMRWIAATWRVASVQNIQPARYPSIRELPCNAMSVEFALGDAGLFDREAAVTFVVDATRPQPATIGAIDLFPETFFKTDRLASSHAVIASNDRGVVRGAGGPYIRSRLVHFNQTKER